MLRVASYLRPKKIVESDQSTFKRTIKAALKPAFLQTLIAISKFKRCSLWLSLSLPRSGSRSLSPDFKKP
ncbi:hypothetical protein L1987_18039 [Smallanthus sonchifolius]|uniref:Uncharacterized protein n=1 Tax=Smallanthus sonchifolius TaxID=185202 RepID=A0ACB9IZH4_9ASTR|nr:hypothetical protein L1987_18039 [Smallanthus sonchifolius]